MSSIRTIPPPGTIPVLPATNMELFRMGHMKTWMDNMLTLMSRGDLQYGDMSTKDFGDITSLPYAATFLSAA